jgi:hypothetical protein
MYDGYMGKRDILEVNPLLIVSVIRLCRHGAGSEVVTWMEIKLWKRSSVPRQARPMGNADGNERKTATMEKRQRNRQTRKVNLTGKRGRWG